MRSKRETRCKNSPLYRAVGALTLFISYASATEKISNGMSRIIKEGSTIIINASHKHTATIILSHGLGDTADGWKDAAFEMSNRLPHVKWILPTAPTNPVTLNGGMRMPSWYDIESLSQSRSTQACLGIDESTQTLHKLIEGEVSKGIVPSRIILAGFSQGGAMSLWTGLQFPSRFASRLGGVVVLSGYLPKEHAFNPTEYGKSTPVFHCHGTADPLVLPQFAEASKSSVEQKGHSAGYTLKMYPGLPHSASMQELRDIVNWISEVLPNNV